MYNLNKSGRVHLFLLKQIQNGSAPFTFRSFNWWLPYGFHSNTYIQFSTIQLSFQNEAGVSLIDFQIESLFSLYVCRRERMFSSILFFILNMNLFEDYLIRLTFFFEGMKLWTWIDEGSFQTRETKSYSF